MNTVPAHSRLERGAEPLASDRKLHRRSHFATDRIRSVPGCPPLRTFVVHCNDQVSDLEAGFFGGSAPENGGDGDDFIEGRDLHAYARITARIFLLKFVVLGRRERLSIRVVEFSDQPIDGTEPECRVGVHFEAVVTNDPKGS